MRMTISAAARLYGIHRATLHRHIKSGRLSCVFQPDGSRALDLSELIRCYGEPPNPPEGVRQAATDSATPQTTGDATPGNDDLMRELVELNRRQADQLERMADRIERLEQALLRLPAPANATPKAQASTEPEPQATPPKASNPPRDFSDLLARFEARTRH